MPAFPNRREKVWLKLSREILIQHPYGTRWPDLKALMTRWFEALHEGSAQLLPEIGFLPWEDSCVPVHYRAQRRF